MARPGGMGRKKKTVSRRNRLFRATQKIWVEKMRGGRAEFSNTKGNEYKLDLNRKRTLIKSGREIELEYGYIKNRVKTPIKIPEEERNQFTNDYHIINKIFEMLSKVKNGQIINK